MMVEHSRGAVSGSNRWPKNRTLGAMRTAEPATKRNSAQTPSRVARERFGTLLDGYLKTGIRPGTAAGKPWTYAEFAGNVPSGRTHGSEYVSPRSVSNWCKGTSLPDEIEPILKALFGLSDRHAAAREDLRAIFIAARTEKSAEIIARTKRDPAGGI
jgi:hypothetical protein